MKVPFDIKITHHMKKGEPAEKLRQALSMTIRDLMDLVLEDASDIITEGIYYDGFLLGSGKVVMIGPLHGVVGFTAPYARAVEFGSVPHWPPPVPIYEWCRRKLVKTGVPMDNNDENTQLLFQIAFSRGGIGRKLTNAEKAFKGIYLKIGSKGTDPHPYFRTAMEKAKPEVAKILRKRLRGVGLA